MKQTIFITGGLGFIGTNLIPWLLRTTDYTIVVLNKKSETTTMGNLPSDRSSQKRIKVVSGNILQKRLLDKLIKDTSIIIHLAANTHSLNSSNQIVSAIMTNVVGTTILLETALKYSVDKFILFSSCSVYGNKKRGVPMDENHPLIPVNPYGASKLAADRIAYSFFLSSKLPVVILRPFNVYGPYQRPNRMIPLFITRLLKNMPIFLNHRGEQKRDWLFVEDLIRAVEMIVKAPRAKVAGEIFNISTGKATTVANTAKIILRKMSKSNKLLQISKISPPEVIDNVGISTKIQQTLGWKPQYSFDEGLTKTIEWYSNEVKNLC